MNSLYRITTITCLTVALSACGTLYKLDVTAHNKPEQQLDKTYVALSGSPDLNVNSEQFELYASQLERVLAKKGYKRVGEDQLSTAALAVYITADIGDASKTYHQVSRPMYETIYSEHSTATVKASGTPGGSQAPPPAPVPDALVGYEKTGFATTVFTKHLRIIAVDLQAYLQEIASVGRSVAVPREIWSIDVEPAGSPPELAEVVPVMIAAADPYVGESTNDETIRVTMSETDKRVRSVKGK